MRTDRDTEGRFKFKLLENFQIWKLHRQRPLPYCWVILTLQKESKPIQNFLTQIWCWLVCNRNEKIILGISMSSSDWQISRDIKDNLLDNKSHIWGTAGFNFTIKGGKVAFNVGWGLGKSFCFIWLLCLGCQMKHWQCFRHFLTTKTFLDVDLFSFLNNIWGESISNEILEAHQR